MSDTIISPRQPKNFDRFANYAEAAKHYETIETKVCMSVTWANVRWLYMEWRPNETRLDYLKRCDKEGILKGPGFAEIKRLEKAAKKEVQNG